MNMPSIRWERETSTCSTYLLEFALGHDSVKFSEKGNLVDLTIRFFLKSFFAFLEKDRNNIHSWSSSLYSWIDIMISVRYRSDVDSISPIDMFFILLIVLSNRKYLWWIQNFSCHILTLRILLKIRNNFFQRKEPPKK